MAALTTIVTTTDAASAADAITKAFARAFGREIALAQDVKQLSAKRTSIRSFYWWDGKVADDEELRLAITTSVPFDDAEGVVASAHNYDVPMIISDDPDGDAALKRHWKAELASGAGPDIARSLVAARPAPPLLEAHHVQSHACLGSVTTRPPPHPHPWHAGTIAFRAITQKATCCVRLGGAAAAGWSRARS